MWYFGPDDYYIELIEYYSWAITSGYPNAYIRDVYAVEGLLKYLADSASVGIDFRAFVIYISTTYIGK